VRHVWPSDANFVVFRVDDAHATWRQLLDRGVIVRASAIARAQRDDMGRITLHLRQHADTLSVSQAYAWRFKPM